MQYQVVQIFPDYLLTSDPMKNMNNIYTHFKITCPATIPYSASEGEKEHMEHELYSDKTITFFGYGRPRGCAEKPCSTGVAVSQKKT